jgi:hypothetical protein
MAVSSYFAECNAWQRQLLPSAMTIALDKVANLGTWELALPSVCMEAHGKDFF